MAGWTGTAHVARWTHPIVASLLLAPLARAQRGAPPGASPDSSAVARATAERAQRDFERMRRAALPLTYQGTPTCDVTVGRICYWDNNADPPLPAEPARIAEERARLVRALAAAAARAPADDWVAGQRVRYLLEARELRQAIAVARACRGTPWWCAALRGLALHRSGNDTASNAAFDTALAAMPDEDRCRWTDLSPWLTGAAASHYHELDCAARHDVNARVWWLAQPLAMHPGRDVRAELLSRRAMIHLLSHAATPYTMRWDTDLATVLLRYGWPTSWAVEDHGSASLVMPMDRALIGHEPTPSFSVMPEEHALDAPTAARASDWRLDAPRAVMRYAPAYAIAVGPLVHQLARFRRGDSTRFVAAYDLGSDSGWVAHSLRAGLVLASSPEDGYAQRIERARSHDVLSAVVPSRPLLLSLEVRATDTRRAARARYGTGPLAPAASLSDLLLLESGPAGGAREPTLDVLLPAARGGATVAAGDTIGLYWECYAPATPAAPLSVRLRVVPTHTGWLHGLARALHLASTPTPIALQWSDAGRQDHGAGRALRLGLRDLPPGRYRIELSVVGHDVPRATTWRDITIAPRNARE